MKRMSDGTIDMSITSPPYDSLRAYTNDLEWSFTAFQKIAKELFRVIKVGGVVVWIVGDATVNNSETGTSFRQALYFKDVGFNLHDTMIYMKDNPVPVGGPNRYFQSFEYCFVLTKGKLKTFNPITEPRRNKWKDKRTVRVRAVTRDKNGVFIKRTVPIKEEVKLQNVWCYTVGGGSVAEEMIAHQHPAIFPEALCRDHIISWSNEGDTIYDPFMGSGTTAKIALLNNRNFIGSEISADYCSLIEQRLQIAKDKYGKQN